MSEPAPVFATGVDLLLGFAALWCCRQLESSESFQGDLAGALKSDPEPFAGI